MHFLFPLFLGAGLLVGIPILIHLFHFRKFKKVYFTNVRFLKEIKEETTTRRRLRNLLVLLMRIFSILFLVLAFAQPYIKKGETSQVVRNIVGIFIDNSFSMNALSQDVPLIDVAKKRAEEIIKSFGDTDQFVIAVNEKSGRYDRVVDKNTALEFVQEIEISANSRPLSKILEYLKNKTGASDQNSARIYLISDFQSSQTDLEDRTDSTIVNLIPIKPVQERNISIDSAWFESPVQMPNQVSRIVVRCKNFDMNFAENVKISVSYAGENKPVGVMNIPAKGSITDTFPIMVKGTGWQSMTVHLTDYPIEFDDNYHLTFEVPEGLPILVVYESELNKNLAAVFRSNPFYQPSFQTAERVNYSELQLMRMIVLQGLTKISSGLAGEILGFMERGGNVVFFPNEKSSLEVQNSLLNALQIPGYTALESGNFEGFGLNTNSFVFRDVFEKVPENLRLPKTSLRYKINSGSAENLLGFRDGSIFLAAYPIRRGMAYVSAVPLNKDVSDFVSNAEIFVPFMFRIPLHKREAQPSSYIIGKQGSIEISLPPVRGDIHLQMKGKNEFIPALERLGDKHVLQLYDQVKEAGIYRLYLGEDQLAAMFAFNYDRVESDPTCFTTAELKEKLPNMKIIDYHDQISLSAIIQQQNLGVELWRWALILGLLFILAEIFILRFWKV